MKSSKEFIIEKLNELFDSTEGVKIRYEQRITISTHIIEILPLDIFENDQEYILQEMVIENEFELIYGSKEDIVFISSDSLNEIREEHYCLGYDQLIQRSPSFEQ